MNKIVKLAIFLGIVSAIAGGALAAVNNVTAPIIEKKKAAASQGALLEIFPDATFTEVEFKDESGIILAVHRAENKGYIFEMKNAGYNTGSPLEFMLGIDDNGNYVGYKVIVNEETNGLGSRVSDDEFKNTIVGKTIDDEIDTLSGATLSSRAIINGINAAKTVYGDLAGVEVEVKEPEVKVAQISLSEDYSSNNAVVENSEEVDGNTVYTVSSYGFHGTSIFEVTVNENKEIVSVVCTEFNDTEGIGDSATTEDYLAKYVGATMESSIDVSAGATYTGKSVAAAVQAALEQ